MKCEIIILLPYISLIIGLAIFAVKGFIDARRNAKIEKMLNEWFIPKKGHPYYIEYMLEQEKIRLTTEQYKNDKSNRNR